MVSRFCRNLAGFAAPSKLRVTSESRHQIQLGNEMNMNTLLIRSLVFLFLVSSVCNAEGIPDRRWVFVLTNLQQKSTKEGPMGNDDLLALMDTMKSTTPQYNGLVIQDTWFGNAAEQSPEYKHQLTKFAERAKLLNIEVIPMIFPTGGSRSLLTGENIYLAEGIPVKDCLFAVEKVDGKLLAKPVQDVNVINGNFGKELNSGAPNATWKVTEDAFKVKRVTNPQGEGHVISIAKAADEAGFANIEQQLSAMKPFHQYELRYRILADQANEGHSFYAFLGVPLSGTSERKSLIQQNPAPDEDKSIGMKPGIWYEHRIVFNTLEFNNIVLSFNLESHETHLPQNVPKPLRFHIADVRIVNVAGFNLLRRSGCPLKISDGQDPTVSYQEQIADAQGDFLRWRDPVVDAPDNFGAIEYRTTDEGAFQHLPPLIEIPTGSRITESTKLNVSLFHGMTMDEEGVHTPVCLSHDLVFSQYRAEIETLKEYVNPITWILDHDEIRVAGRCRLCVEQGDTPARLLGRHIQRSLEIVKDVDQAAEVFTLNDMFDPKHNAVKLEAEASFFPYVDGSWQKSWEFLPLGVKIYNWNDLDLSLKFFGDRNREQMFVGYYDVPENSFKEETLRELRLARKHHVIGVTYASYDRNYKKLPDFAKLIEQVWSE